MILKMILSHTLICALTIAGMSYFVWQWRWEDHAERLRNDPFVSHALYRHVELTKSLLKAHEVKVSEAQKYGLSFDPSDVDKKGIYSTGDAFGDEEIGIKGDRVVSVKFLMPTMPTRPHMFWEPPK